MFRIAEDPSSGSLVQCLAKITRIILSCPLTWRRSVLRQHILTRCACVCVVHYTERQCQCCVMSQKNENLSSFSHLAFWFVRVSGMASKLFTAHSNWF